MERSALLDRCWRGVEEMSERGWRDVVSGVGECSPKFISILSERFWRGFGEASERCGEVLEKCWWEVLEGVAGVGIQRKALCLAAAATPPPPALSTPSSFSGAERSFPPPSPLALSAPSYSSSGAERSFPPPPPLALSAPSSSSEWLASAI